MHPLESDKTSPSLVSSLDNKMTEEKKEEESKALPPNVTNANPPLDPCGDAVSAADYRKESQPTGMNSSSRKRQRSLLPLLGTVLRTCLLDLPLMFVFSLYISTLAFEQFANVYLMKQMQLMLWTPERAMTELTYYHRKCDENDQTAHDTTELLVTDDMSTQDAVNLMVQHGASVYPNLLSPETATELREYILKENKKNQGMIYVIQNENRWSFYLQVDQHPIVTTALKEVLNKPLLASALEEIAGRNPAVIEFTTITSAYGAKPQHWHQDVVPEGNGAKYSRNFVPSYSLFIPLQNTTSGMGATGICPGTHMCAEGCGEFCSETGFQMSGRANNWPTGWGALVNQQTTHRGTDFTDPNAPHRVVFILTFAPRPQFGEKQVETRMIGTQGSYSLHWSQWGHTLRDFQNPDKYMRQPWRTLRSLGIYKPKSSDWGWDFFTQVSGRISNGDVGYSEGDLWEFLDQGGFSFLPKTFQGEVREDDDAGWIHFATETFSKCQAVIKQAYGGFAALYVVAALLFALAFCRGNRVANVASSAFRLLLLHGFILLIAWWCLSKAKNRSWAHNIRAERQFSVPSAPHVTLPDLPASLPLAQDVLILQDMQSEYMATFTRVLDIFHPGNKAWKDLIRQNSRGYLKLPPILQKELRSTLLERTHGEQRRIMSKNRFNSWAQVDDVTADWFCHKELSSVSSSYVNKAMKLIDHHLAETRFGYWRDTMLHRKFIPLMLMHLQDDILHLPRWKAANKARKEDLLPSAIAPLAVIPKATHAVSGRSSLPPRPHIAEPFRGAWLREGDLVEATYNGEFQEWYRARIASADSDFYSWNIVYEDGEEEFGLCSRCIRPFEPYGVDEAIEVRVDETTFSAAVVVASSNNETYVVRFENGETWEDVPVVDIRRVSYRMQEALTPGAAVSAKFPDIPHEWFRGVIARENGDGTYAIQYDDGDFAPSVDRKEIRLV